MIINILFFIIKKKKVLNIIILMIIFMIYEPLGMAKLWENLKQSIRLKLTSSGTKSVKSSAQKSE